MSRTLTVNVTADDIASGIRGGCASCPVALAIDRALGLGPNDPGGALVWTDAIRFTEGGRPREVPTSPRVRVWVESFDAGRPVRPFTFTLELPEAE